jgi:hypothetical protein
MGILGKLLIVFNLLAAGAFAYLTLGNWKARQDLAWAEASREIKLRGYPVEPPEKPPSGVDKDNTAFVFQVNEGTRLETLSGKKLNALTPPGGQVYGGEAVADQTAEVKRLQPKVLATIPALPPEGQDPKPRFDWLQTYLLNLARSGADRDGVNGLFDLRFPERAYMARRDLPLLGRTASQQAALRTLIEIADLDYLQANTPDNVRAARVAAARETVKRFLLGEVPHGVTAGDKAEGERKLTNAIENVMSGRGGKEDIAGAASQGTGFDKLADLAVEPLTDRASIDKATEAIRGYVVGKAIVPTTEAAAMSDVVTLIRPPALGFNVVQSIDKTALDLLNSKFDEAMLPAKTFSAGEKARKIAHLLYHIDAHRHTSKDAAAVADRKEWHQRVSTIVGMQEYVRAAEAQASEYAEAAQRLIAVITEEESSFRAQYQDQLQRVTTLYTQWLTLEAQHRAQDAITKENERLKEERKTERDNLGRALEKATADAKAALEKLQNTQSQLFAIQKQLRDAQAAVLSLEGELRKLELGPGKERVER